MTYRIGIDLSSTFIGVCILNDFNEILSNYEFELPTWNDNYITKRNIYLELKRQVESWTVITKTKTAETTFGIEVSNHTNASLTQRFSYLQGILETLILQNFYNVEELKNFNANGWYEIFANEKGIDNWTHISRDKRKAYSIENHPYKSNDLSDNIADSYWIALYCKEVKSTYDKRTFNALKRKEINSLKSRIREYEIKIKAGLFKNQDKAIDKLKDYKEELKEVMRKYAK